MKPKLFLFLLVILSSFYLFIWSSFHLLSAQHFTSPSYIIDWGNFNITSGSKTSPNYSLTDTVGQNAPGQFNSTGFIVKSGFQYIHDGLYDFTFRLDNLEINLGSLVPGVGSTDSHLITITTPSGNGYQIMAAESKPLSLSTGTSIPNTSCDSGTCNSVMSGVWSSASAYGFGFNALGVNTSGVVTGIGTSNYFTDSTYYRPFANLQNSEVAAVIMSENQPVRDRSARVTYKANISTAQASGSYQNSITFIAVPLY